jgi:streptogramin lyase
MAGIVAGPDGNLWSLAQQSGTDVLVRITTGGSITTFPLAQSASQSTLATKMSQILVVGSDGNIWFTAVNDASLAICKATTQAKVTCYPLAGLYDGPASYLPGPVAGPDKAVWIPYYQVASPASGNLIRVATSGKETNYNVFPQILIRSGEYLWMSTFSSISRFQP